MCEMKCQSIRKWVGMGCGAVYMSHDLALRKKQNKIKLVSE